MNSRPVPLLQDAIRGLTTRLAIAVGLVTLVIAGISSQNAMAANTIYWNKYYTLSETTGSCLDIAQSGIDQKNLQPLILVHGWNPAPDAGVEAEIFSAWDAQPNDYNPAYWGPFIRYFCNHEDLYKKYKLFQFSYWTHVLSLKDLGSGMRDAIDLASIDPTYSQSFGSKPLTIIAHSMGGLVTRTFMNLPSSSGTGPWVGKRGGDRVIAAITLGTPHHGTPMANGPVRDARAHGWGWYTQLFEIGVPAGKVVPYNIGNRPTLWWDNYDHLWDGSLCPRTSGSQSTNCPDIKNDNLLGAQGDPSALNLNLDTAYDNRIIAYAGVTDWKDEYPHCQLQMRTTWDPLAPPAEFNIYGCGVDILSNVYYYKSDGIVPVASAQFDGHTLQKVHPPFSGYDHGELICGLGNPNCSSSIYTTDQILFNMTDKTIFEAIRSDLNDLPPSPLLNGLSANQSTFRSSTSAQQSDLIPQSINLSSSLLTPGQALTASWLLANIGNAAANATSLTAIRINRSPTKAAGADLQLVSTTALASGASAPQSVQLTAPSAPGKYYVWVIADNYGAVTNQSDATNDLQPSAAFVVSGPVADLVPQNITPSTTTVTAGSPFTVTWTLANVGAANADSPSVTVARINQSQTSAGPIANLTGVVTPALAAGSSIVQGTTLTAPTTPGTYYVWIIADDFSDVSNQTNTDNDLQHSVAISVTPAANCIPIANVNDLQNISNNLSGNYCLSNDIDASATVNWNSGAGFLPIGSNGTPFNGILDGYGHSVNNLYINNPSADINNPAGLFVRLGPNSIVSNIGLRNVTVINYYGIGSLAGFNNGLIKNVFATGTARSTGAPGGGVGLLVAHNSGQIIRSYASGVVGGENDALGGIVGYNSGSISESFANVSIDHNSGGWGTPGCFGGLTGHNLSGTILRSYAMGPVNSGPTSALTLPYAGGLAGCNHGEILESYSVGHVSGVGKSILGGLVGGSAGDSHWTEGTASNSYWDTTTSNQTVSAGGIPATTAQLKAALPSGFDPGIWGIDPGITYPYLLWQKAGKPDSTTIVVGSSLNPSIFAQPVTFTATVRSSTGGTPTGFVTFYDGATLLGYAFLSSGTASLRLSTLSVGTHAITASYGGDGAFAASTSAPLTQTVNALAATTLVVLPATTISASGTKGGPFSPAAFVYQLSASSGTIDYTITNIPPWLTASSTSGSVTTSGTPVTFTVSASALSPGTYDSGAIVITNATNGQGNTSIGASLTVNPAATWTSLQTSLSPSVIGQAVTFSASVASNAGNPTGTVTFKDGATLLGSVALSAGSAALQTSTLALGDHSITAVYGGDANFAGAAAPGLSQTVKGATTTAVVSSVNPSAFGQPTTFTATVTPTAPASGVATGMVMFMDGTTTLGSGSLSNGTTSFSTSTLVGGDHSITAVYGGSTNFAPSSSSSVIQRVNAAMLVSPATPVTLSGTEGGPFSPAFVAYQLSAASGGMPYSITGLPNWLTASASSGALTTTPTTITLKTNSQANTLAPGTYGATINFNNTASGMGNTTRNATLTVATPTAFRGDATIVSVAAGCPAGLGLTAGGIAGSTYRPRFNYGEPETAFSLILERSMLRISRLTGKGQMHGTGNYVGSWVDDRATNLQTFTGAYDLTIVPSVITSTTQSVQIDGTLSNLANFATCSARVRGNFIRYPNCVTTSSKTPPVGCRLQ